MQIVIVRYPACLKERLVTQRLCIIIHYHHHHHCCHVVIYKSLFTN